MCAIFDTKTLDKPVDNGVTVQLGATPTAEDDDPIPIYMRGAYFDGVNDFIRLFDLVINYEFTIEAWIRPNAPTDTYSSIFSINRSV
jgi:hypothetical protein